MPVCLVVPMPPPYGGIANWSKMLTEELDRRAIAFTVVNTAPRSRSVDGRTLWDRVVLGGVDMLRAHRAVRAQIARGCRLLHITTSGQLALLRDVLLLRLARARGVASVYHIRFGRVPTIGERGTIEWRMLKLAASTASLVIAIDQPTYDVLSSVIGAERVRHIPNPIDIMSLPSHHGPTRKVALYLGWVTERKGIDDLLTAWSGFRSVFPDWELKIVGPCAPDYLEQLNQRYPSTGVTFAGELSHALAMRELSQCEIFVLPSHTEGCPNVILEAMALERAVVGTRVGAVPELLSDECGFIVDPHDPTGLCEVMGKLAADGSLRRRYGANAGKRITREYALDHILERYLECWDTLS